MTELSQKGKDAAKELKKCYVFYPDFPKKGINFWDFFAVTGNKKAFDLLHTIIEEYAACNQGRVDIVVGLESRGFLIGTLVAQALHCPFVPIRKKGKLPGEVLEEKFTLEYGEDVVQMQKNSIKPGQRVVIVDDCIATGGTLTAAHNLIQKVGGDVVDSVVLYDIPEAELHIKFPVTILA